MSERAYLLVDAYNVIFALDDLQAILKQGQDAARDYLADKLLAIHDAEDVRVAMILDSRQDSLQSEYPFGKNTFEYLYAPAALTADGVIERIVRRVKNPAKVTVVSNDNLVREATRSAGALAIRPEEVMEWAAACDRRLAQDAARRSAASAREFRNGLNIDF